MVDDLQWADLSSLQALVYLGRRLEGADVGLAVTVTANAMRTRNCSTSCGGRRGACW